MFTFFALLLLDSKESSFFEIRVTFSIKIVFNKKLSHKFFRSENPFIRTNIKILQPVPQRISGKLLDMSNMSFIEESEITSNLPVQEVQDEPDTGFKNSLDRLTLDTLRVLCNAEGLSSSGAKKELVERFAAKTSNKIRGKLPESIDVVQNSDERRYQ
ncbi:8865_t:CDS:2, partial [Dentiscutata erythropus]